MIAAIAYNPNLVTADEAPKTWKDVMDPKWADAISVKVSNSGLQHVEWYVLRQLYGNDFWQKLAPLKPHAFDSYVQQFDRLVNGQDKVALTAQYSGYLIMKAKGAPVEFVYPPDGLVATPQPWGVVKEAPHPEAAQAVPRLVPRRAGTDRRCAERCSTTRCAATCRRRRAA